MTDYFFLLNLKPAFDLDIKQLEAAYFHAQQQHHPDRVAGKPKVARQAELLLSADVNQAYNVLKDPLSRAEYLLSTQGILVGTEQDTVKPSPEVLMEAMELREEPPKKETLEKMIAESIALISGFYTKGEWSDMAQETLRLGYLVKAKDQTPQQVRGNA